MKQYTIEQIRNYILSQDSMGDILYNLKEENIDKANEEPIEADYFNGELEYPQ
jgi:hypothetical protein